MASWKRNSGPFCRREWRRNSGRYPGRYLRRWRGGAFSTRREVGANRNAPFPRRVHPWRSIALRMRVRRSLVPPFFPNMRGPPAMGASPQSSYLFPSPGPLSPRFTFPRPLVILPPSKNRFRIYGAGKFRLPPAAGNQGRPAGKHMTIFIDPPPGTRRALAIALLLTSLEFSVGRPMSNVMPPAE